MTDAPSHKAERGGERALERHVQTFIAALLTGLVAWVGFQVQNQSSDIVRLETQILGLQQSVNRLQEDRDLVYDASRAQSDFAVRDREIADLRERLRDLERAQLAIERTLARDNPEGG